MTVATLSQPAVSKQNSAIKLLIGLAAFTAPFTQQRLGSLQPVELVLLGASGLFFLDILRGRAHYSLHPYLRGTVYWLIVLGMVIGVGSVFALLTVTFYVPLPDASALQGPPWLTLSRLAQLWAMFFGFCAIANACVRDKGLLFFALKVFIYASIIVSIYASVSYLLHWSGIARLPGVTDDFKILRMRGTFIEGGPYGLYMVGAFAAVRLARYAKVFSAPFAMFLSLLFISNVYFSVSKSAMLCLVVLFVIEIMLGKGHKKIKAFIIVFTIIISVIAAPYVFSGFRGYIFAATHLEELVSKRQALLGRKRALSLHLVAGRVATMVIAPKIVQDRPLFGVGLGNYPLVRNDPAYRGALPAIQAWDLHAVGLLGYTTEIGIPAMLVLIALLLRIPIRAVVGRVPGPIIYGAAFQPVACMVGTQITFFYPWLLSALTFSLIYHHQKNQKGSSVMPSQPPVTASSQDATPAGSIIVSEIFYAVLRKWWLIGITVVVCVLGGLLVLRAQGVSYTAQMRVAELTENGSGGGSASQGSMALLPINLGNKGAGKLDYYLAMLTDPLVVERLAGKSRLLEILYPRDWNPQAQDWYPPGPSLIGWVRSSLKNFLGVPVWVKPNSSQISDRLKEVLKLSADVTTGYWTITVTRSSRKDALELLQILHQEADEIVRERDRELAESHIEYIRNKLQTVQISEHRSNLTQLLMMEEQKLILSSSNSDYAAMLLSPPSASDLPSAPKIVRSVAVFIVLGILLGAAIALVIDPRWRRPEPAEIPSRDVE